jgi:histone-lysine N-methyltransferase SUV420H
MATNNSRHLRRYLLPYAPNSRVDIHTTNRYSHITLHPELAVYATRPLAPGTVLQELQGSVVELPEEWRKEMDLSDDFIEARLAAGEESEDELTDDDDETAVGEAGAKDSRRHGEAGPSTPSSRTGKGKGKEREPDRGARRSGRTRRRDFSIVWSELKRCYQLFLGPARFLNVGLGYRLDSERGGWELNGQHDCTPNVELLRQGKYVTFRVTRPVRIGDELTTT